MFETRAYHGRYDDPFFFGTSQLSTMETSNLQNKNQNLIKNKEIYKEWNRKE